MFANFFKKKTNSDQTHPILPQEKNTKFAHGLIVDFENLYRDETMQKFLYLKTGVNEKEGFKGILSNLMILQKASAQYQQEGKEIRDLQKLKEILPQIIDPDTQYDYFHLAKAIINIADKYFDAIAIEMIRIMITVSKKVFNSQPIDLLILIGKNKVLIEKVRDKLFQKVKNKGWNILTLSQTINQNTKDIDDKLLIITANAMFSEKAFKDFVSSKLNLEKLPFEKRLVYEKILKAIKDDKFRIGVLTRDKEIIEILKGHEKIIKIWREKGRIKEGQEIKIEYPIMVA